MVGVGFVSGVGRMAVCYVKGVTGRWSVQEIIKRIASGVYFAYHSVKIVP